MGHTKSDPQRQQHLKELAGVELAEATPARRRLGGELLNPGTRALSGTPALVRV
jgi:hypothetical protein